MNDNIFMIYLFLLNFAIIYSKTINTDNLDLAISEASPGDIIELKSGEYSSIPYKLKSGKEGSPIIIKAEKNSYIYFKGSKDKCIFELNEISYISIEGPFELKDSLCGIKAMDVTNIKISGLTIINMREHGLLISGENIEISNNEISNCVIGNRETSKILTSGWNQTVSIWGKKYNSYFSKNITFKKNYIRDSWGEGLHFLRCDGCEAISNNITNGFSMNIYCDSSKNIIIDGNVLRVNSEQWDSHLGKACGIGLSSGEGDENKLDNIIIQNNIIIGTRIGVYFFQNGFSEYSKVKILHNTLWNIYVTSLWFDKPYNIPIDCELRNNFIYIENWIADFYPKSSWTIGNNYFFNYPKIPIEYSDNDGESKAAQNLDLNRIFNNKKGNCNYYDRNLDIECLRPSTNPIDSFNLFHKGSKTRIEVNKDFAGCFRAINNPSIGAFEYFLKCTENYEIDDLQIKFAINYCAFFGQFVKLMGSFCSWEPYTCPSLFLENLGNPCYWTYTFNQIPENFNYKFGIYDGNLNNIIIWESDPNREFNIYDLATIAKSSTSGNYNDCSFNKNGNLITLMCSWR